MSMSKTAAIRESAGYVSIHGSRTNWTVIGPHNVEDLDGPTTEISADSYTKAAAIARVWRAEIVLSMMDAYTDDAHIAVEHAGSYTYPPITDLRALVQVGLDA